MTFADVLNMKVGLGWPCSHGQYCYYRFHSREYRFWNSSSFINLKPFSTRLVIVRTEFLVFYSGSCLSCLGFNKLLAMNCRSVEVLNCWTVELLNCWSVEVLKCAHMFRWSFISIHLGFICSMNCWSVHICSVEVSLVSISASYGYLWCDPNLNKHFFFKGTDHSAQPDIVKLWYFITLTVYQNS